MRNCFLQRQTVYGNKIFDTNNYQFSSERTVIGTNKKNFILNVKEQRIEGVIFKI